MTFSMYRAAPHPYFIHPVYDHYAQPQHPQWHVAAPPMRRKSAENYQQPGHYPYGNYQQRQVIRLPSHNVRRDENLTLTKPKSNFFQPSKYGSVEPSVHLMNLNMYKDLLEKYKMLGSKSAKQLADKEYAIILNERSMHAQRQKQLEESPAYQEAKHKAITEAQARGEREAADDIKRYRAHYGSGNFIHNFKIGVDFSNRKKYPNFNPKVQEIKHEFTNHDIDGLAYRAQVLDYNGKLEV